MVEEERVWEEKKRETGKGGKREAEGKRKEEDE